MAPSLHILIALGSCRPLLDLRAKAGREAYRVYLLKQCGLLLLVLLTKRYSKKSVQSVLKVNKAPGFEFLPSVVEIGCANVGLSTIRKGGAGSGPGLAASQSGL